MSISSRKTLPVSSEMRPSSVSRTARGCSKISFCMKCLKPPFSAMMGSQVMCWTARSTVLPSRSITRTPLRSEHGDVAIGQKEHVARVGENRGDIAGDKIFVLAQADHRRRARARRDDFVGVGGGKNRQGIDAGELPHGLAHGVFERAAVFMYFSTRCAMISVSVSVTNLWPSFSSCAFQLDVIFDDAVVDDDDLARCSRGADARFLRSGVRAWPSACGRCRRRRRSGIGG